MHVNPQIESAILTGLESTSYACTELVPLSGGYVNFVYLGKLVSSLPTTPLTTQIIIKHAEPYVAANAAWALPVTRIRHEALMLGAMNGQIQIILHEVTVSSPYLYRFFPQINTTTLSRMPDPIQVRVCLSDKILDETNVFRIGASLGRWMRRFHDWGSAPEQASLREKMKKNTGMAEMKYNITYGRLEAVIAMHPAIFEGSTAIFANLEQRMKAEIQTETSGDQLIHGDFDCRNVLLSKSQLADSYSPLNLCVVDWEISHVGSLASDIAQMFADLYLLDQIQSITAGCAMIAAFSAGYGALTDEVAFRLTSEFGAHLLSVPTHEPGEISNSQVREILKLGRDMVVHAEGKDKAWFRGGILDGIYTFESLYD